ncbi:MAG: class IV adenylate cyclase [Patescibacteria group bacterium]
MEIEIRAKLKDPKKIIEKLISLGAEKHGEKKLSDYYFGDIGLYEKIGHSFWIRLRVKEGGKIELAYKGSTGVDGVYDEIEQDLQDLDKAMAIFTKIGLSNEITVHKNRTSYKLGDISVEIDDFGDWGTYAEAEITGDNVNKKKLFELFETLGISKEDIFEKGYITLMLEEKKSPFTKWIKN